jgi:gliding motility-associated-like protein
VLTALQNSCATVTDTVRITVKDLFIPEGFSPNGDGVNDIYEITGITAYPNSDLKIFNRWGQEVFGRTNYANDWNGNSNAGSALPADTYFYVLNLSSGRTYNGHVILRR